MHEFFKRKDRLEDTYGVYFLAESISLLFIIHTLLLYVAKQRLCSTYQLRERHG